MIKKTAIALASLALAQTAAAQSSVTLFGIVDAAISHYEVKSAFYSNNPFAVAPIVVPSGVKRSQNALTNSGYNTSRIGFRGTEDLGGGLSAGFWLEAGMANDTGVGLGPGGALAFNRRSTVSVTGGFGEIRVGRDYVPTFWNDSVFDPFGAVGLGSSIIFRVNSNLATSRGPGSPLSSTDNYVRTSNSVGYFLPRDLGGFYGQVMYGFHENVKSDGQPDSPSKRGQYYGGRFGYAKGPFDVGMGYGESTAADALVAGTSVDNKIASLNLGASYDFGPFKLFGEVARSEDKLKTVAFAGVVTTRKDKYDGALIGVHVPIGPGLIRASYGRVKYKADLDATTEQYAIGYVHNLSKRTALYTTIAKIKIKNGQNNPAIMGATVGGGTSYLSTGAGVQGYAPRSAFGYDLGVRHSF